MGPQPMNGIVAIPMLLPARRLVRGTLLLGCSVLCVSLIGAVHTRPFKTGATASDVKLEPIQASVQIPVQKLLTVSPAGRELLHDVQTLAGSFASNLGNVLTRQPVSESEPSLASAQLRAPPKFTVKWMEVTAYCACKKCCGPRAQGLTASGRPVSFNGGLFVAADKALPFNTRLLIPGYADGQAVPVLDRGGAIKGDKLDVYFPSHEQARQWGRRFITVTVLN